MAKGERKEQIGHVIFLIILFLLSLGFFGYFFFFAPH